MSISPFFLQVDGLQIAGVQSRNEGRPVLLLHGSGASGQVFQHQLESELGETFRLIAIDLPGHGLSDNAADPARTYAIRGMANLVGEVIDTLELVAPVIYGWSLGGHVAMELASRGGDIAGLALGGSPPIGRGPLAAMRGFHTHWDMLLASKENYSDSDAERFMRLCYGDNGTPQLLADIKRTDGRLRTQFFRSLMFGAGADQRRLVETAALPVAMIDGIDDPFVRRSYVEHLNFANLWKGQCHTILGATHAPFWQQPQAFNRLLHLFVRDLHAATAEPRHAALPIVG